MQDNVKVATLRSIFKIEDQALYPLEIMSVYEGGQQVRPVGRLVIFLDYLRDRLARYHRLSSVKASDYSLRRWKRSRSLGKEL